jgi:hypothetical protein
VNSVVSGNMLKILVVSYHTSTSALDNMPGNDNRIVASLAPPIPVPPRLRRPINPRKRKGEEWHHLRPKIWRGDGWSKT